MTATDPADRDEPESWCANCRRTHRHSVACGKADGPPEPDPADRTAEIRQRAEAARAEPWCYYAGDLWRGDEATRERLERYDAEPDAVEWPFADATSEQATVFAGDPWRDADAEWIAHARSDVPWLLDRLAAAERRAVDAEAKIAAVEALHERSGPDDNGFCAYDDEIWPCPTVRALSGLEGDKQQ